jgi:hypothetical protein
MATRQSNVDQVGRMKRQLASQGHLLDKLKMIRALHMASYNSTVPVEKMAAEFFYAIGDILEGQKPEELKLNMINKEEFLKELKDG